MSSRPFASSSWEVEPASPADAAALLLLRRRILEEGHYFVTEPDEERLSLSGWLAQLKDPHHRFLVARKGLLIGGYVSVERSRLRRSAHVGRLIIALEPEIRGQGMGRRLMEAAIQQAREEGLEKLSLAVFAENERAQALYRRVGFVVEGRRVGEFKIGDRQVDDVLMALLLKKA